MQEKYDLIVIGAGASGLTAAAEAGKAGKTVLMFDRSLHPAEKVFISGGGKCNFTNLNISADHYVSENPHFCKSALARFSPKDFIERLNLANIGWEEREDGKLFAFSGESIRRFLIDEARNAGAESCFGVPFFTLSKEQNCFCLKFQEQTVYSDFVLISTGGLSYPTAGATGIGYTLAQEFGLAVIPPAPALVPLLFGKNVALDLTGLAGISAFVRLKTGKKVNEGSLLLTQDGISGPVVLQSSLYWEKDRPVEIDFLPQTDIEAIFKTRREAKDKKQIASVLGEFLPKRLAERFAGLLPPEKSTLPMTELSDKSFALISENLKRFKFIPTGSGGWPKAEITKGGVDTRELSSTTMESKRISGLYFAGEIIDVSGELGGFNLHWAWASGVAAGTAIGQR